MAYDARATRVYDHRFLVPFFNELSRRNHPVYPDRRWFAALAVADREQPCDEPRVEKPPLSPIQVEDRSRHWHVVERNLMTSVSRACDRWWRKYGDPQWREYGR
jgi:hypothetical protein